MTTKREEAQRLLNEARRDAWWGGVWGNMGWALDHIVQFASGFLRTATPSYEVTLGIMLRMGKISRADYDTAMQESTESRVGQTVGVVAFVVVNGAAAVAKSGGNWFICYIGKNTYYFGGEQALVFLDMLMKTTGIWTKP